MKMIRAGLALALLIPAPSFAETSILTGQQSNPVLGQEIDGAVSGGVKPAFKLVEGVSDGVYNFLRVHVIGNIMPSGMTRNLKAAPNKDSAPLFDKNLHEKEARLMDRMRAAYPIAGEASQQASQIQAQRDAWRHWAAGEQISVAVDSFADTMIERYQLELFGRNTGEYAQKRKNWDPGFLTMAGLLGSTFLYLNGMHAAGDVGPVKFGLDLSAGMKWQHVLQACGNAQGIGALELGLKNMPITVASSWGVMQGRLHNERFGLNYRLRY